MGSRPGSRKVTILVCVVAILSACKTAAALYVLFLNAVILSDDPLRLAVAELNNWVGPCYIPASPLSYLCPKSILALISCFCNRLWL
jgi:hypothetical protein